MKKLWTVLLALVLLLPLTGCSELLGEFLPGGSGKEENSSKIESSVESSEESEEEEELVWTKDVVLSSEWTAIKQLSSLPFVTLSVTAQDAQPIRIDLSEEVMKVDGISSSEGGIEADVSLAQIAPETMAQYPASELRGLQKALASWNEQALNRGQAEMEEARIRHKAYQATNKEKTFIYLTSWISMQVARADTQLVSYATEVYRYNREYEPNYYEIHGVTLDPATGEQLSLKDFFTDTNALMERIERGLIDQEVTKAGTSEHSELVRLIKEAVEGCRDDGSFCWLVYPEGIEFRMVQEKPFDKESMYHLTSTVFVPFSDCKDILREGVTKVSYDYFFQVMSSWMPRMLGFAAPLMEDGSRYMTYYLAQIGGEHYLYGSGGEHTVAYALGDTLLTADDPESVDEPYEIDRILGEIHSMRIDRFGTLPDPAALSVSCFVTLLQEMNLSGTVRINEYGWLERIGDFTVAGSTPMMLGKELEVRAFENAEADDYEWVTLEQNEELSIVRSDGESYIDCQRLGYEDEHLYRLYVDGSAAEGWYINDEPMSEVIGHMGWWEE